MGASKSRPKAENSISRCSTPKAESSNCFLGFAYLLIRGCVDEVVFVTLHRERAWDLIPCHVVALNRRGQAIHFCRDTDGQSKFWFRGRMSGIPRRELQESLRSSGRTIIGRSKSKTLMWAFTAAFMLLLLPVWTLWWVTHPYIWLIGSTLESILKRK